MKNTLLIFFALFLLISCGENEATPSPSEEKEIVEARNPKFIKKDIVELEDNFDSYKVLFYRFGKIALRSSAVKDSEQSADFVAFKSKMESMNNRLGESENASLSPMDYIGIYRDYRSMKKYVLATDEDIFPILSDAMDTPKEGEPKVDIQLLTGKEKIRAQNAEHALLSIVVLFAKDFGTGVSLYEASKTNPELFSEGEEKALLQFFRGFLFGYKGFYYLSEKELTSNIEWLDNNPNAKFKISKELKTWNGDTNKQIHTGFHGFNHLLRGYDRIMMDTDADKQLGLKDFEVFLADANKIGLNNELTWAIETYVYLNQEESEKAIPSLTKLKSSDFLSNKEKKSIDEAIEYLGSRESDKVLNTVYDKVFLGKIVSKYLFRVMSEVDWQQVLKDQDVPHADELVQTYEKFNEIFQGINTYGELDLEDAKETALETAKQASEGIKEGGKKLWEKAKGFLNE